MDIRHASFAPHGTAETRLVLLGSLPGAQSLAKQQYYGNSKNNFWKLLESVFSTPLILLDYTQRLEQLDHLHIGLWDVIESAARQGSLDSAIKNPHAQNLFSLFDRFPKLEAIAFNGKKAASFGRKILGEQGAWLTIPHAGQGDRKIALINLPSSSPAHARPFAEKEGQWRKLAPFAGSA